MGKAGMRIPQGGPSKDDPSRLKHGEDYDYSKEFYQSWEVAEDYNFHRWGTPERAERNFRKWKTILNALALTGGVKSILDLPCGAGRFTGRLAECGFDVIAADISMEMMEVARTGIGNLDGLHGYVRADAEHIPLADGCVDCVMSIRFFFHVDADARRRILSEMARVSRRWLIIDYRHKYNYRYTVWRTKRALRLTDLPLERLSRAGVEDELGKAGLVVRKILPVTWVFSDKWIVLCEKSTPTPA
jgi:SAM-dependent methyltransferase